MIKRRDLNSNQAIRPLRIEVTYDPSPEQGEKNSFKCIKSETLRKLNVSDSGLNVTPSSTSSLASSASSIGILIQ